MRKYSLEHVLLTGRPGSGKSTALIRLLLEDCQSFLASGSPALWGNALPPDYHEAEPLNMGSHPESGNQLANQLDCQSFLASGSPALRGNALPPDYHEAEPLNMGSHPESGNQLASYKGGNQLQTTSLLMGSWLGTSRK